jgi:PAS domain S-box-containing protein
VSEYAWVSPRNTLGVWNEAQLVAVAAYLATSGVLIWTVARMQGAERHAKLDAERRRASEWALQESQRRLEIAIQSTSLGWFDWDLSTADIKWSAETRKIYGVGAKEEPTIERFYSLIHPDDRTHAQTMINAAMKPEGDGRYSDRFRIVRPDGAIRWVTLRGQVTFSPWPDRRAVGLVGTVLDVTEQKLAEHALVSAEKFAATGRLAASIAHEINNPLEAVTNLLYLVETVQDEHQRTQFLALAQQELARASSVAAQMLRFYREDKTVTPTQIADVLDSVVRDVSPRLNKYKLDLRRDYDHELPALRCFPGELRQVFNNLVQNAIDASPAGGSIVIRVRQGRGWSNSHHDRGLRVTIADQGAGMHPETRSRLFEPFFTTKGATGTGLGLWISNGLVQKHSGYIRFRTSCARRRGTVFTVFLPFGTESTNEAVHAGSAA